MKSHIHRNKYNSNKNVVNKNFNKYKNNDWQITIIFYAALHLIEGTFPQEMTTKNHQDRRVLIDNLAKIKDEYNSIKIPYRKLYDYSINARYRDIPTKDSEVMKAKSYLSKIEENLKWVE